MVLAMSQLCRITDPMIDLGYGGSSTCPKGSDEHKCAAQLRRNAAQCFHVVEKWRFKGTPH